MTDPGAGNTFVGHRRWVLYPPTRTMGVGDIPAQSNALYVVQPELAARALGNRGRLAARWFRAGSAHAAAVVASVRRQRRFLERDGDRHRERHAPDR